MISTQLMPGAERKLLLHRVWRRSPGIGVALLLFGSLLDHAGAFGYHGNDWQRFDGKSVHVDHLIDDQSFDSGGTVVRLLGVRANQERITSYVETNLEGQEVTLRLDAPQTRDAAGQLLAYVYLSPADCWNVDLIRQGSGYADRQSYCSMITELLAAESARRRSTHHAARKSHS